MHHVKVWRGWRRLHPFLPWCAGGPSSELDPDDPATRFELFQVMCLAWQRHVTTTPRTGAVFLFCKAYEVLREEQWLQVAKDWKAV